MWLTAIHFAVLLFIFDTLYTVVIMAYNALFTELASGLKDRSSLAAVREGLAAIAGCDRIRLRRLKPCKGGDMVCAGGRMGECVAIYHNVSDRGGPLQLSEAVPLP